VTGKHSGSTRTV